MTLSSTIIVRFADVDRAGIVYFARIFDWCHQALEDMLALIFDDIDYPFGQSPWIAPMVHAEADFGKPIVLGDVLTVSIAVEAVGTSSITYAFDVRSERGDHAHVRHVHACIDRATLKGCAIPETFLDDLRRIGALADGAAA